jgi:hypothetical protein
MTTNNMIKCLTRGCAVFLVCLCVVGGMAADAWATHEILKASTSSNVSPTTKTRLTDDLWVRWVRPADMGSDTLKGYYYLWNDTGTSLNSEDIAAGSFTTDNMISISDTADPVAPKPKEELASLDSGSELFLHVITHYQLSGGGEERVSQDIVFGPFWIDNVAPTGTIRIVDENGDDTTWTSTTTVNVRLSASQDTVKAYLNESPSILTSLQIDPYSSVAQYTFEDSALGEKTLYAWFEDSAGNITPSSAPASYELTLVSTIYINPFTTTIDLSSGGLRGFSIEGPDAAPVYNWSIIQTGSIAEFQGGGTARNNVNNANSVTIQALAEGTFQLQAVPTSGTGTLTSGTITVVKTSTTKEYNLVAGLNIIALSRAETGWSKAADLITTIGATCESVTKWDASSQGFVTYAKAFPIPSLNFNLVDGDAYFVSVTGASTFAVTGQTITRTYSLLSGLNLIGLPESKASITKAADLINSVGTACQSITKWDATSQGFVTYAKAFPIPSLNFNVSVGEGYFLDVNATTGWQ